MYACKKTKNYLNNLFYKKLTQKFKATKLKMQMWKIWISNNIENKKSYVSKLISGKIEFEVRILTAHKGLFFIYKLFK